MNSNLLAIERTFLARPEIKTALNLTEYKRLKNAEGDAKKKRFENSLKLGAIISKAKEWFLSAEGKAALESEGIYWSMENFYFKVFGLQKSFANKLQKAASHPEDKLSAFRTLCEERDAEGKDAPLSVDAFNSFAKNGTIAEAEAEEESTEAEATTEATTEAEGRQSDKSKFIFTYLSAEGEKTTVKMKETGKISFPEGQELGQIIAQIDAFRSAILNGQG